MSDFKEGDLLEHRASGERCVFHQIGNDGLAVVSKELIDLQSIMLFGSRNRNLIYVEPFELTKVKEESNG